MNDRANQADQPMPSKTLNIGRKQRLALLIIACCIGFLLADVATRTCFENPFWAMIALGVITAQLTVICVWGTLVRGTFWIRLPWTLLLLLVSWCAIALGITIENGSPDTDAMLGAAALWTFGFATSFVPLKIAALCFRWQIVQDSGDHQNVVRNSRYAIRDIMIGTLLLALTMAIGRAMLPNEEISFTRAIHASSLNRPEPLIAITIYGIISLLVKLPCIWIALGEESEKIRSRIYAWIVYCLVLAFIEILLLIAVLGNPGSRSGELFAGMIISHQLMGAIMLGVCLALRGMGYRLEHFMSKRAQGG